MKQQNQAMLMLLAVTSASVSAYGFDFYEPVQPPWSFQVMVHRGMMHQAPEYARPALERVEDYLQAIEWGIDLIQTDHPLRVIRAVEMANLPENNQSLPIDKHRDQLDLSGAVIVTRSGELENAERVAAEVLVEEMEKRTGIRLATTTAWPENQTVIAIASTREAPAWGRARQC